MKTGQTMIEYVVCMAAVVIIAGIVGYVVTASRKHADRSITLVASEYP